MNLLAVCDGLAQTHVDEVVATEGLVPKSFCGILEECSRADEGICFTRGLAGTIDVLNDFGIQSWRNRSVLPKDR